MAREPVMPGETYVRLKIISRSLSPEEMGAAVGIPCDKSWRAGDKRRGTIIIEKENGWVIDSNSRKDAELSSQLAELLKKVQPYGAELRALSMNNTVEVSCVIYADSAPALYFEKDMIGAIAALGASLDIDLYIDGDNS